MVAVAAGVALAAPEAGGAADVVVSGFAAEAGWAAPAAGPLVVCVAGVAALADLSWSTT